LTSGGNESDVGVWQQGLLGCSRKILATKGSSSSNKSSSSSSSSSALQYQPCRSHVFAPSWWSSSPDAGFGFSVSLFVSCVLCVQIFR
jgi:hypothetical protein